MSLLRKRGRYERRGVRSVFGSLGLVGGLLAVAVAGPAVVAGAASASEVEGFNPMAAYRGWNVVSFGDLTMVKTGTARHVEGPVAAKGDLVLEAGGLIEINQQRKQSADTGGLALLIGGALRGDAADAQLKGGRDDVRLSAGAGGSLRLDQNHRLQLALEPTGVLSHQDWTVGAGNLDVAKTSILVDSPFESQFEGSGQSDVQQTVAAIAVAGRCPSAHRVVAVASANANENPPPASPGAATVWIDLEPGFNFWEIDGADLSALTEVTVRGTNPSGGANTLVIYVTGDSPEVELKFNLTSGIGASRGVLFVFPEQTQVTHTAKDVDGSVLAPRATFVRTGTSNNSNGTIVAAGVELGGGETHFFPFTGIIPGCGQLEPKVGSFSVEKQVTGATDLLTGDEVFTIGYSYQDAGGETRLGSVTLKAGETKASDLQLPVGTVVTFSEPTFPAVSSGSSWAIPQWTGLTNDKLTIEEPTATQVTQLVTVKNTLNPPPPGDEPGSFEVSKTVDGQTPSADASFVVAYSLNGVDQTPLTLDADNNFAAEVTGVPAGTSVTLTETPGAGWGTPSWTVGGEATTGANVTFSVASTTKVSVGLNNTPTPPGDETGSFEVSKTVGGAEPDDSLEFTVAYSYDGGDTVAGTLTLEEDNDFTAALDDIPAGAEVTLTETGLDTTAWGTPTWTVGGVETEGARVTFTVGSGVQVAVGLDNDAVTPPPSGDEPGSFSVSKTVNGGDPDDSLEFTVGYSYLDGEDTLSDSLTLSVANNFTAGLSDVPAGTLVTLTETPGAGWGTPSWTVDGGAPESGTSVSFAVGSGTQVAIALNNTPLVEETGSFTVRKAVTGTTNAAAIGATFTIAYTWAVPGDSTPAGSGSVDVTVAGDPVTVANIPVGAVVTLTEPTFPSVPGVAWGTPTFSDNRFTITAGPASSADVVVTNTVTPPGTPPPNNPPNNPPPNNPPVDTPPDTPETEVLGDRVTAEPEDEAAVAVEVEGDRVLAFTGAEPRNMIVAALVLVVAGLGALVLRRRPAEG